MTFLWTPVLEDGFEIPDQARVEVDRSFAALRMTRGLWRPGKRGPPRACGTLGGRPLPPLLGGKVGDYSTGFLMILYPMAAMVMLIRGEMRLKKQKGR